MRRKPKKPKPVELPVPQNAESPGRITFTELAEELTRRSNLDA